MTEQPPANESRSESAEGPFDRPKAGPSGKSNGPGAAAKPATEPAPADKLTAEEQMALYEKELKENDWGHQPC